MTRLMTAVALLVATLASAQETVLVPIWAYAPLHGANSTTFQTRLVVATAGGTNFVVPPDLASWSMGRLMQLDPAAAIFYELDVKGSDGSLHRTTVPVARERDFKKGPSVLAGLTTGPKYDSSFEHLVGYNWRNRVRIYDLDNTGTLRVRVRIVVEALQAYGAFFDQDVAVTSRDGNDPSYPFFADVPLPDLCITAPTGLLCRDYAYTVTLEPGTAATRYWAFASATDNVTGETSLFFAQ